GVCAPARSEHPARERFPGRTGARAFPVLISPARIYDTPRGFRAQVAMAFWAVTSVRVFDRQQRYADVPYTIGDVNDYASLLPAFVGASAVVHTVAPVPGARGDVHWAVSVQGTRNVIRAVVYSGKDIVNGDESMPYAENHVDEYTKHKVVFAERLYDGKRRERWEYDLPRLRNLYLTAEAEQLVLAANGKNGLLTCALRPCGMFGPRDALATAKILSADVVGRPGGGNKDTSQADDTQSRRLPARVTGTAEAGRMRIQIGNNKNLVDFTYIENVSYAHAFNITNGEPIAFWDFPRALWAKCGFRPGKPIVLPYWVGYLLAALAELVASLLSVVSDRVDPPTFTRLHVKFMKVNRYFSIRKARVILGYEPL
ncbi:MAG: hypothetical protein BJ554DRAFT_6485, partial [Olpidium bornovanus]